MKATSAKESSTSRELPKSCKVQPGLRARAPNSRAANDSVQASNIRRRDAARAARLTALITPSTAPSTTRGTPASPSERPAAALNTQKGRPTVSISSASSRAR
jgi:hypothetical protein